MQNTNAETSLRALRPMAEDHEESHVCRLLFIVILQRLGNLEALMMMFHSSSVCVVNPGLVRLVSEYVLLVVFINRHTTLLSQD